MPLDISSHPSEGHSQHQQASDGRQQHVVLGARKFSHSYNGFEFPLFCERDSTPPDPQAHPDTPDPYSPARLQHTLKILGNSNLILLQ